MIRYTVVWTKSARDQLATIWLDAHDRNAITAAANEIDVHFSRDASAKGVELHEGLRALFVPPLKAIFAVSEDDAVVEVLRVTRL
jgi:plasmid stabilization system protein ParE